MEKFTIERTIKVDVIRIDKGIYIDAEIIQRFLNEAYIIEDTIGETGNYTDDYIYFETESEKTLEPILLGLDVIRKSPNHAYNNDRVGLDKYTNHYFYWLSDGYKEFRDKFYELKNKTD
jgi:hypothetical protein